MKIELLSINFTFDKTTCLFVPSNYVYNIQFQLDRSKYASILHDSKFVIDQWKIYTYTSHYNYRYGEKHSKDMKHIKVLMNLIVFYNEVLAFTECQKSLLTVRNVNTCPKDGTSWQMAASRMNCESVQQECSKALGLDPQRFVFQYHCLINSWMNALVEVCALNRSILGYCAEFNTDGALIQDNYHLDCRKFDPPCPNIYNSAEAYKYQSCYDSAYNHQQKPFIAAPEISISSHARFSSICLPTFLLLHVIHHID